MLGRKLKQGTGCKEAGDVTSYPQVGQGRVSEKVTFVQRPEGSE